MLPRSGFTTIQSRTLALLEFEFASEKNLLIKKSPNKFKEQGLHEGDVVRTVNGAAIRSEDEFVEMMFSGNDEAVRLDIVRDNASKIVTLDVSAAKQGSAEYIPRRYVRRSEISDAPRVDSERPQNPSFTTVRPSWAKRWVRWVQCRPNLCDFLVTSAGPGVNFMCAWLFISSTASLHFSWCGLDQLNLNDGGRLLDFFGWSSLLMGFIALVPFPGSDGSCLVNLFLRRELTFGKLGWLFFRVFQLLNVATKAVLVMIFMAVFCANH